MSSGNFIPSSGSARETLRMPRRSRYADQPIDASSRRSIEIQSNHDGQNPIDPEYSSIVADCFYHAERFWRAVIPLDGVDEVFGQTFNFSKPKTKRGANGPEIVFGRDGLPKRRIPGLIHVQSRFTLKPGYSVKLYPLEGGQSDKPAHQLNDFVYSVEVVGPPGIPFNLRDALAGNLLSAHRFMSTQEMVFERIVVENNYVMESPALPIDGSNKRDLLIESLLRSHRAGMTETYYLFRICGTNNCTSNPFQVLDKVIDYRLPQRIGSVLYRLPLNPRFYLRIRGLDADPSMRKLVRSEFHDYIVDPETQKRKREYVRRHIQLRRVARERRHSAP